MTTSFHSTTNAPHMRSMKNELGCEFQLMIYSRISKLSTAVIKLTKFDVE